MNLKRKKILLYLIPVGILIISFIGYSQYLKYKKKDDLEKMGALTFLIRSDKDDKWENLLFIQTHTDSLKFDSFLKEVLAPTNLDLNSIIEANRYIEFHKRNDFLPELKEKFSQLNAIGKDSSWVTIIEDNYSRKNSLDGSPTVLCDLRRTIAKFEVIGE